MKIDVAGLTADDRRPAARLLAAAFIDDPAFVAIGPDHRSRREKLLDRFMPVVVDEALRYGGPNRCARHEGEIVGVALCVDGRRFPVPGQTFRESPPFLLAGPGPTLRGARTDTTVRRAHPDIPHLYLWYLAARPDHQRQGIGRALVGQVIEDADDLGLPVCLDTTRDTNVPYYRSLGFRETAEFPLPRGARLWSMHRDRDL